MDKNESLMTFPCDFPIKIIGVNTPDFLVDISEIIRKYFPNNLDVSIRHPTRQIA
jgi:putative lipoic acid-binding regulatory protein